MEPLTRQIFTEFLLKEWCLSLHPLLRVQVINVAAVSIVFVHTRTIAGYILLN